MIDSLKTRLFRVAASATARAERAATLAARHGGDAMAAARLAARREAVSLPVRWRRTVEITAASLAAGDGWPVCRDDGSKRQFYRRLSDASAGLAMPTPRVVNVDDSRDWFPHD